MGNSCSGEEYFCPECIEEEDEFVSSTEGNTYMIIFANDYKKMGLEWQLTCSSDAAQMKKLAEACGVQPQMFLDDDCTPDNLERAVRQTAQRMKRNDTMVFYYAGHGTQQQATGQELQYEDDGQDECLVLMGTNSGGRKYHLYRDNSLAALFSSCLPKGSRLVIITDCCHSGTIADFEKPCWAGIPACSIAGCQDSQLSNDSGCGGVLTSCLCLALGQLQKEMDGEPYSVAKVFNRTIESGHKWYSNYLTDQCFQLNSDAFVEAPDRFEWPLQPQTKFNPQPRSTALAFLTAPLQLI
jgi:hypothetical protein